MTGLSTCTRLRRPDRHSYPPHCLPPCAPAGLLSCLTGSILRLILEFTLPKDGSLVAFGAYAIG